MVFSHELTSEQQFRILAELDLTHDVTDIEGIGGGMRGYDFWLRFRCSPETAQRLIATGYMPVPPSELEGPLDFDAQRFSFEPSSFTPAWNPGDLDEQQCFKKVNVRNEWTPRGSTWFAYDPVTGWVHMFSEGT